MEEAVVVLSRQGLFAKPIRAWELRSREDARKLWPFACPDTKRIVTWVSPSFYEDGSVHRRAHFRQYPSNKTVDLKAGFEAEEKQRQEWVNLSEEHKKAQKELAQVLQRRLDAGMAMPWGFKDPRSSDFPLVGDFLLGADTVQTEYTLPTAFGSTYRLDIAVLGPAVTKYPMVLGGIEIERAHAFDGRKALIAKSMSFVLISIDITDMSLEQITPQWAEHIVSDTTRDNENGRRLSYFYVHDVLYPLYVQLPWDINKKQRHQYLVFADTVALLQLKAWIEALAQRLDYPKYAVLAAIVNDTSAQSRTALENAGEIVGHDWEQFNARQFLRVTLPRSTGPSDLKAHRLHLTLSRLLLCKVNALVGYQYRNEIDNENPEGELWVVRNWDAETKTASFENVLPKRLAEPINRILALVAGQR